MIFTKSNKIIWKGNTLQNNTKHTKTHGNVEMERLEFPTTTETKKKQKKTTQQFLTMIMIKSFAVSFWFVCPPNGPFTASFYVWTITNFNQPNLMNYQFFWSFEWNYFLVFFLFLKTSNTIKLTSVCYICQQCIERASE